MSIIKIFTEKELDAMDWNDLLELHVILSEQLDLVNIEIDNRI
ncbi:major tail protein [Bacillus phage SWEP1]|nr:major tail protein [Bacillus phage SWEP1]